MRREVASSRSIESEVRSKRIGSERRPFVVWKGWLTGKKMGVKSQRWAREEKKKKERRERKTHLSILEDPAGIRENPEEDFEFEM